MEQRIGVSSVRRNTELALRDQAGDDGQQRRALPEFFQPDRRHAIHAGSQRHGDNNADDVLGAQAVNGLADAGYPVTAAIQRRIGQLERSCGQAGIVANQLGQIAKIRLILLCFLHGVRDHDGAGRNVDG